MPTKYGVPLVEIWRGQGSIGLGYPWHKLSRYSRQPDWDLSAPAFPEAQGCLTSVTKLASVPFATMELIWCPYGMLRLFLGLSILHRNHVPSSFCYAWNQLFTTVKGLEAVRLPRRRIIGISSPSTSTETLAPWNACTWAPRDYGFGSKNVPSARLLSWWKRCSRCCKANLQNLMQTALWNGGFYLA